MRVILLGNTGQLGQAFSNLAMSESFELHKFNRSNFNILNLDNFFIQASLIKADFIVNMIAYTDVNGAEQQKEECNNVNHYFPERLAKYCKKMNVGLIHISTDYIFDGTNSTPYTELDKPNPLSEYGTSKYMGENSILNSGCYGLIIRTSGLFSEYRTNFLKTMINLLAIKDEIHVVNDQIFNPTYANDLAGFIIKVIYYIDPNKNADLIHYSGDCATSWYLFTKMIKENLIENDIFLDNELSVIKPVALDKFKSIARRPLYSVLDNSEIKRRFEYISSNWKLGVIQSIKILQLNKFFDKYKARIS